MIKTFGDVYSHRFGSNCAAPEAGIRVGTVRVASYVDGDTIKFESLDFAGDRSVPEPVSTRRIHLVSSDESVEAPIYDGSALTHERVIPGPAIVTTENTTYLVEPGWRLEPTPQGAVWFLRD